MAHSNFSKELKASVALNNIGASLLEQRCYEQAASTLRDATTIMKSVYSSTFSPSHLQQASKIDLPGMIDQANKRRSQPAPSTLCGAFSFSVSNLADCYSDHAFYYNKQDAMVMMMMESSSIYAIRIDDVSPGVNGPCCMSNPDIQTAAILHNFAVAHLCLAHIPTEADLRAGFALRQKRLQKARKLFELSNSILEKCTEVNAGDDDDGDELALRQTACLNIAVLHGLVHTLQCQGFSVQNLGGILDRLNFLHGTVKMADEILAWYNAIGIVTAPAA